MKLRIFSVDSMLIQLCICISTCRTIVYLRKLMTKRRVNHRRAWDGGHFFSRDVILLLVKQTRQITPTLTAVLKRNSRCGSASAVPMKVVYSTIFFQPNQCKRWLWWEAVFLGCLFCNFNTQVLTFINMNCTHRSHRFHSSDDFLICSKCGVKIGISK